MKFLSFDFVGVNRGDRIRVDIDRSANVLLLDESNYRWFKSASSYHYIGGHYKRTPIFFSVPSDGNWYVIVNLGGFAGSVHASAQILRRNAEPMP